LIKKFFAAENKKILTLKQIEILELISLGYSNVEIGEILSLSIHTVILILN